MLTTLISQETNPEKIIEIIKKLDMTAEVKKLFAALGNQVKTTDTNVHRAALLDIVNPNTNTLTLHCNDFSNISIKTPSTSNSSALYSAPGYSIFFAINHQSFTIQRYSVTEEWLTKKDSVTVSEGNPVVIDGRDTLLDCNPPGEGDQAFIGSINLPDRSADISVFDRKSLRKIAWFPHDDSAARYLVSLELLEAAQDPDAAKVAEEVIYHYHPAVAWRAFQMIYQKDRHNALHYVPLLRQLQNRRLDYLLDLYSEAV
ncbi:hypothetical protein [Pseudomonas fluorescens]|uniref:Uncharacterized protein n=1 Tax=Pseudomonas fluorescens TaxID=294 RepID=A0A5E7K1S3_PSEFL|nr:hypothetical protein [Pseudomonas fluorescens]VVO94560.1 hypothetical protein PS880_02485 [Pseudomonas fluorescens]